MTGKNIQSMQEIMLEFIVMNYKEVFARLWEGSISRKKVLPPSLFQKIIYKSKEMNWYIHRFYMDRLLTFRDVLSWMDIDVVLYYGRCSNNILKSNILKMMSQVEYPLKNLSICVHDISDESMSALQAMGSTIECLDLKYYSRNCTTELFKEPFPNLRKLCLTKMYAKGPGDELYIDLSRFSETLEELILENETLDDRLIRSIACLKKLKVLSFPFSYANYFYFNESLCAMNHLRTLDIRNFKEKNTKSSGVTPSKLFTEICKMPNLENLDMAPSTIKVKCILDTVKCRKWKKFGFYDSVREENLQPCYDKLKFFADRVFGLFKETILSTFEIYAQDVIINSATYRVLRFLPFFPQEQIVRVEKIILNSFSGCVYKPHSEKVLKYIKTGRCTDDFITKLVIIITSYYNNHLTLRNNLCKDTSIADIIKSAPVARKMLEIVENDLNKGLCRKLLEMIFICSYDNLSQDIDVLGLRDVCNKARASDFLDDNALMAMKTLLTKMNQVHEDSSDFEDSDYVDFESSEED